MHRLSGYSSWKSRGWCQFELAVNGLLGVFAALRHQRVYLWRLCFLVSRCRMWQQAGSASGFKNYVACELPQLLGTISESTSVMQFLFSISLQMLQFCPADWSLVRQQWTQFLRYMAEQLSLFLQSINAHHTYINMYCMYENLRQCIVIPTSYRLLPLYNIWLYCMIRNVSLCRLHTNTSVC